MEKRKIEFKKGSYNLNPQPNFNYQLNRTIMWGGGNLEDIEKIAGKINDSASWKRELIGIGDKAISENRIEQAIAYYRMSEFFMYDGDPDKKNTTSFLRNYSMTITRIILQMVPLFVIKYPMKMLYFL